MLNVLIALAGMSLLTYVGTRFSLSIWRKYDAMPTPMIGNENIVAVFNALRPIIGQIDTLHMFKSAMFIMFSKNFRAKVQDAISFQDELIRHIEQKAKD